MITTADINEFKQLIEIMEKDNNNKKVTAVIKYQNLYIQGDECELMIRFHKSFGQLIIARMTVNNKRQGTGTKILDFLIEYAKDNGYNKLVAETVLSERLRRFLGKFNFVEQPNTIWCYELPLT